MSTISGDEKYGHETPDLYPTEITDLKEISVLMQRKLAACLNGSEQQRIVNLARWANEWEGRAKEKGIVVEVDPFNPEQDEDGNGFLSPIVEVHGVVRDSFDFDRAIHEVQHGLLDTKVGKIDEHGNLKDPDLKL